MKICFNCGGIDNHEVKKENLHTLKCCGKFLNKKNPLQVVNLKNLRPPKLPQASNVPQNGNFSLGNFIERILRRFAREELKN